MTEKEGIQKKLEAAKAGLQRTEAELERLMALIAPLTKQLTETEAQIKYFEGRVEKLAKILAGM